MGEQTTTTKDTFWNVLVFLAFKGHDVTKWYKNKRFEPPDVVKGAQQ